MMRMSFGVPNARSRRRFLVAGLAPRRQPFEVLVVQHVPEKLWARNLSQRRRLLLRAEHAYLSQSFVRRFELGSALGKLHLPPFQQISHRRHRQIQQLGAGDEALEFAPLHHCHDDETSFEARECEFGFELAEAVLEVSGLTVRGREGVVGVVGVLCGCPGGRGRDGQVGGTLHGETGLDVVAMRWVVLGRGGDELPGVCRGDRALGVIHWRRGRGGRGVRGAGLLWRL